ncbi:MAG: hypothetical protein M3Y51_02905 [Actinomycetota bacterium]|nr:hypothetical protein [Actinomycetota bacterium]
MDDDVCRQLLETAVTTPDDVDRFSSNSLFGQPGIYPDGTPMVPATGPARSLGATRQLLVETSTDERRATACFDDEQLVARVPDHNLRAALCLLAGGPAEPMLDAFVAGDTPTTSFAVGPILGEGRVIGAPVDGAPGEQALNERYRFEHPGVIAPSLAHALCHHTEGAGDAEEATLHGVLAATHAWLLASVPGLGDLDTELSRRQASLTITLLNARSPGSWRASIRCPDGPGTIPGGNPALQCPDLWSIPFVGHAAAEGAAVVPEPVRATLRRLTDGRSPEVPARYDDSLGEWLTAELGTGPWFGPCLRVAAGRALGLC